MIGKKKGVDSATGLLPITKCRAFLDEIINLVDTGALKSIVDLSYPPERVRDAYRRSEGADTTGTVAVTLSQPPHSESPDPFGSSPHVVTRSDPSRT